MPLCTLLCLTGFANAMVVVMRNVLSSDAPIWELLQGGILAYEGLQGNVLVIGVKVHWNAAGLRPLSLKAIVSQKKSDTGRLFCLSS